MSAIAPQPVSRLTGTTAASGVTTQTALVLSDSRVKIIIRRVKLKHTAGSTITFTPRIYKVSGAIAASINQEFEGSSTGTAVLFDTVAEVYTFTDSNGKLYLEPGPNAGADNVFNYEIYFEIVR